jgi:M6 family metalloprotease-like protein
VGRHQSIWTGPDGLDVRSGALRQLQIGFRQAAEAAQEAGEPIVFRFPVLLLATWWDEEAGQTSPQFQEGNDVESFTALLDGFGGNPRGTLTEFYFENSYGQFVVEVDVYGPYTSLRSVEDRCYYGGIDPGDDGGGDLDLIDDQLGVGGGGVLGMAVEAVPQADPEVDFSQYDNDGDGQVDFLGIIHSGPDMAATGDPCHTWSHANQITLGAVPDGGIPTTDGVFVDRLFTMPEIDLEIGVATHEMAHALGEPDYYNPSYTSMGTGDWDIMAGGSWFGNPPGSNPTHFNPASRVFQGWVTPTIVHEDARDVLIAPRELSPAGYTADQPNPNLFLVPTKWIDVGDVDEEGHEWTETDVYGLVQDGERGYVIEGYYLENVSRVVNGEPIHTDMDRAPYFDRQALSSGLLVWHFDYVRRSNTYHGANDAGSDPNRPQMDPMEFDRNDNTQELQLGLTRGEPSDLVWDAATGITSGTRLSYGPPPPEGGTAQEAVAFSGASVGPVAGEHEFEVEDNPSNVQMNVTVAGAGDCILELFDPDGGQVGGTQDSGAVGDAEDIAVEYPIPGTWTVVVSDFAGCGPYSGEIAFTSAGDIFTTKGAADTWSNWTEEPTGWAFTNVRSTNPEATGSNELSGPHETGPEALLVDIVNIGADEVDASPGYVTAAGPVNAGREAQLSVPIFNNGGAAGDVGVEVRYGSAGGPVVAAGDVALPAYGRVPFDFSITPPAEGAGRLFVVVDPAGTLAEAHEANNVQASAVAAGPANPSVLVVDDDGGADAEDLYAGALSNLGVPYAVVDGHASAELMSEYDAVIWEAGLERYQGQLDREDRAAVAEYLGGGGRLLLTSPRAAAALGEGATSTSPLNSADMPAFLAEWFGVEYLDTLQVGGGKVLPLGDILPLEYHMGVFPGRPLQDVFGAAAEGVGGTVTPVAGWDRGGEGALMGVRVEGDEAHGGFRSVFLGFNLLQLSSSNQAIDVVGRVLTHFEIDRPGIAAPAQPLLFHTQDRNRTAGQATPISAIVVGPRDSVTLAYRRHGTTDWFFLPMTPASRPNAYRAIIPGGDVTADGLEYSVVVAHGTTKVTDGVHAIGVQK